MMHISTRHLIFLLIMTAIHIEAYPADTTTISHETAQPSDSVRAVTKTKAEVKHMISKEKAAQLADDYLKSQDLVWGKPVLVAIVHQSSSILVKGADNQMHEETWDSCYYVQYETSKNERELTGIKTVVVTRDGLKVAIPTSE